MRCSVASAILTLFAVLGVVGPVLAADDTKGKPVAVAVEAINDLGVIPVSDKIKTKFEIRNDGDQDLIITEARPACGCTVVEFDSTIPPGKVGTIEAVLDTTALFGPTSKTITIFTNDPDNPSITLTIQSEIRPFIGASPGYARFITVQQEAEGSVEQLLWSQDGSDFAVTGIESPFDYVTAPFRVAEGEEKRSDVEGSQWIVDIRLAEDAPIGALSNYLTVVTDHPKQKFVRLPLSGFVRPILAVTPPMANFEDIELESPLRASLQVRNFATSDIALTDISSSLEGVTAEIVPLEEGRRYQVNLVLSPEMPKGDFNGKIVVKTNSTKKPKLEIEMKGSII